MLENIHEVFLTVEVPLNADMGKKEKDQQTKRIENEILRETLQETSDGGIKFQPELEQPKENMNITETI